jgi:hypothetical protein
MSTQQAQSNMRELRELKIEIKRRKEELKILVEKEKQLQASIKQYLYQNDQPGIKYQDLIVLATEKKVRQRKTKNERNQEIEEILLNYGVRNPDEALVEISDALKGKQEITFGLKIKRT